MKGIPCGNDMDTKQEITYQEFVHRETEPFRAPYDPELEFYTAIQQGNTEQVTHFCSEAFSDKKGLGLLSDIPLQNLKYHFTITAAMIARYCIEGGMEVAEAYNLSDYYIYKVDSLQNLKAVSQLHDIMCLDYTSRMQKLLKHSHSSRPIRLCLDYIYDHLHTRITIPILAKYVGLSCSYLSRLFKQETGSSISTYILNKKLETARNMLLYSNYTISMISTTLAFPSQSYFTSVFHRQTGMTPGEYRTTYYRHISRH